jgi:dTDP-4-amino-4,6-dideoxygalactose transaminase
MISPALLGGQPAFPDGLPFFRPATPPLERVTARLAPSYERGMLTNGQLVRQFEAEAAERLGVPHVVAVSSCTAGLMLVFQALARPGTVVVMPSFTFSATAHAAHWAGAVPRFAECDVATCQLDVADAAGRLDGASLLVGTHVFGSPCTPEEVEELGRQAGMPVVFDAAHGFGATRDGRPLGTFGDAEIFSLSPTKPMTSGEGGLVAIHDDELARRVRLGVDYGNPGDYDTLFAGLNARMSELHAAVGLESLAELDDHLAVRRDLADRSTYKDYTVIVDEAAFGIDRDAVAVALKAEGIDTRPYFYPPVHRQHAYAGDGVADLPATDWLAQRVISLPLWRAMPVAAIDTIAEVLAELSARADEVRRVAGDSTEGPG